MCVAIPMMLSRVDGSRGTVCAGGLEVQIELALVPGAAPGDWLIVHAGFAIERLDEAEARLTLSLLAELAATAESPARDGGGEGGCGDGGGSMRLDSPPGGAGGPRP